MKHDRKIYIAFADGRYKYDCAACDKLCCRSGGTLLLNNKMLSACAQFLPFSNVNVVELHKGLYLMPFENVCYFLRNNRCYIQSQLGKTCKPYGCNFYPLRIMKVFGEYDIVTQEMCPTGTLAKNGGISHRLAMKLTVDLLARDEGHSKKQLPAVRCAKALQSDIEFRFGHEIKIRDILAESSIKTARAYLNEFLDIHTSCLGGKLRKHEKTINSIGNAFDREDLMNILFFLSQMRMTELFLSLHLMDAFHENLNFLQHLLNIWAAWKSWNKDRIKVWFMAQDFTFASILLRLKRPKCVKNDHEYLPLPYGNDLNDCKKTRYEIDRTFEETILECRGAKTLREILNDIGIIGHLRQMRAAKQLMSVDSLIFE